MVGRRSGVQSPVAPSGAGLGGGGLFEGSTPKVTQGSTLLRKMGLTKLVSPIFVFPVSSQAFLTEQTEIFVGPNSYE